MNISPAAAPISSIATSSTMPMLPRRSAPTRSLACSIAILARASMPNHAALRAPVGAVSQEVMAGDIGLIPGFGAACGTVESQHVGDDLGHRLVVLGRDLLVDLDGGVQRAGERWVLDDRYVVLPGD